MHLLLRAGLLLVCGLSVCWAQPRQVADQQNDFGVLVMAHGGSQEWNDGVLAAVRPLTDEHRLEVAFGMADAASLQEGVARLEARGVKSIGVIRLFISGDSWYERTRQILGVVDGAPERSAAAPGHDHPPATGHAMGFWRVDTDATFSLTRDGLVRAKQMGRVLADRARQLSVDPEHEDVLILAHGPADDAENDRWLANMDAHANAVRESLPFRQVRVETLREDWPEEREVAEQRVREFVQTSLDEGAMTIVIPFRVHGFGPYAEVLDGLDYIADGQGLLPHEAVTEWLGLQAESLRAELSKASAN